MIGPTVLWLLLWTDPMLREREVDSQSSGPPLLNALSLLSVDEMVWLKQRIQE
jgi:hypothetical protein